jgi:hypothetical protein
MGKGIVVSNFFVLFTIATVALFFLGFTLYSMKNKEFDGKIKIISCIALLIVSDLALLVNAL